MPKRKYTNTRASTRPMKKRKVVAAKKRYVKRAMIPRGPRAPQRMYKLKTCKTVQLSGLSGGLSSLSIRWNDCHDPFNDSAATKPYGWTRLTNMFEDYVVLGAKLYLYLQGDDYSVGAKGPIAITLYRTRLGVVAESSVQEIIEKTDHTHGARFTLFQKQGERKDKLQIAGSTKKQFQIKNVRDNWSYVGQDVSNSPAEQAFFMLAGQPVVPAGYGDWTVQALAVLSQVVLFNQAKELNE